MIEEVRGTWRQDRQPEEAQEYDAWRSPDNDNDLIENVSDEDCTNSLRDIECV
jgi:hypothetical protein